MLLSTCENLQPFIFSNNAEQLAFLYETYCFFIPSRRFLANNLRLPNQYTEILPILILHMALNFVSKFQVHTTSTKKVIKLRISVRNTLHQKIRTLKTD